MDVFNFKPGQPAENHKHLMRVSKPATDQAEVISELQAKMAEIQAELDVLTPLTQTALTPTEIREIRSKIKPLREKLVPYANLLSAMTRSNYNTVLVPGNPTTMDIAREYLKR
jgi:capsule polysaccharide export protein KpsE/RkpR